MKHLSLALLVALVGLTGASLYKAHAIETLLIQRECIMATLTTTWTSACGTHTITTTKQEGETDREHAQRHKAALVEAQQEFPVQ